MSMNIRPIYDRVVVTRLEEEQTSPGGIVIPDTAKEKSVRGKVVAVGPGKKMENGERHTPDVKKGDEVLFGKYSGSEVKLNGEEYVVMREDDIIAIVE
jgi:chaperonin GroES